MPDMTEGESLIVEVCMTDGIRENVRIVSASFPPGSFVGQVPCHECLGTGWWGYAPLPEMDGECVDCKGTGREWVGLA